MYCALVELAHAWRAWRERTASRALRRKKRSSNHKLIEMCSIHSANEFIIRPKICAKWMELISVEFNSSKLHSIICVIDCRNGEMNFAHIFWMCILHSWTNAISLYSHAVSAIVISEAVCSMRIMFAEHVWHIVLAFILIYENASLCALCTWIYYFGLILFSQRRRKFSRFRGIFWGRRVFSIILW